MRKIVVGLGFGDEGKGSIVDYLAASSRCENVIKFSGGPFNQHKVVTEDGTFHGFDQFSSGTFVGTRTLISENSAVSFEALFNEANILREKHGVKDPLSLVKISKDCLILTPFHMILSKYQEKTNPRYLKGQKGVDFVYSLKFSHREFCLKVSDLLDPDTAELKLRSLASYVEEETGYKRTDELLQEGISNYRDSFASSARELGTSYDELVVDNDFIEDAIRNDPDCIFEGTGGLLLDEWTGFYPYVQSGSFVPNSAESMCYRAGLERDEYSIVGVTRTYLTRKDNGPLIAELSERDGVRIAPLSSELLSLSKHHVSPDQIALTFADSKEIPISHSEGLNDILVSIESCGEDREKKSMYTDLLETIESTVTDFGPMIGKRIIEKNVGAPIVIESYGPRAIDKKIREN